MLFKEYIEEQRKSSNFNPLNWIRKKINDLRTPRLRAPNDISKHGKRVTSLQPGKMYIYGYDPKTKEKMPYYDVLPVVFPFETYPGGFIGINMHYLPPRLRIILASSMIQGINANTEGNSGPFSGEKRSKDEAARVNLNYQILKRFQNSELLKPCIKKYLYSHIRTHIIEVNREEWVNVMFLPYERFKKKTSQEVWKDSENIINARS